MLLNHACSLAVSIITGICGLVMLTYSSDMQTALNKMHALMAADTLAACLDHNKLFDVYSEASNYQLGACIVQEGYPVAYFPHKLSKSQQNYTVTEKEMLSIVATLNEF